MIIDRKKIARDLVTHRNLWETILTGDDEAGKKQPVRLREIEQSSGINIFYIGVKQHKKADFEKMTNTWNLLSIQFSPNTSTNDDLVAVLWVE